MLMTIRILVADDHPVVRRGLKNLLGRHPGWEVIDEAEDGVEAVEKASRLLPDIIVLDITMPKMNGLEACRRIRKPAPACEILFLTQHDSPQDDARGDRGGREGLCGKVQRRPHFASRSRGA